jgi:hypothetical protein
MEAVDETSRQLEAPVFDYSREDNFGGFPDTLVAFTESRFKLSGHETVRARAIDELDLRTCSLIKADVEGMELGVIGGALRTIERCRPSLYLECHPGRSRPLLASLDMMGYRLWMHSPPYFSASNFRGATRNPWPGVVSTNVLAIPSESARDDRLSAAHDLRRVENPLVA